MNDNPLHRHTSSNHPRRIIRQIPLSLSVTYYPPTSQMKQRSQNDYKMGLNDTSFPAKFKFAPNNKKYNTNGNVVWFKLPCQKCKNKHR